ncbi:MAG: transcription termination/antitermination protein NusA [Alphaproteobacteria bacterium]|nr:MAG: transcription termination/antitermination protein NusA [Alphaproteobacteria bacterium]
MIGKRATEFLQVADFVAQEQGLEKDVVFEAIEAALAKAAELKYGKKNDIIVTIDRDTGATKFYRQLRVVVDLTDPYQEIHIEDARKIREKVEVGDVLQEELPSIDYDRISAQESRAVIFEKIKEKKRAIHYKDYIDRIGDMVTAIVKRNEITYFLLEFDNKVEAILRKDDMLPQERLQVGERVKAVISNVRAEGFGPVIRLSRTSPRFLIELLKEEVTEIQEGQIEVKSAARDPGSRSKVAVYAADPNIDPVGACIGVRGSKIQEVSKELMGEKVDVVEWSSNPATYVINALSSAEITKVVIDEEDDKIEVIVPEAQFGVAIGKKGQNVKLASALTGWKINVLTEAKEAERYAEEIEAASNLFKDALGIDEMRARLLASEGYGYVEQIAEEDVEALAALEGFEKDAAKVIKTALQYLQNKQDEILKFLKEKKAEDAFIDFDELTLENKKILAENDVKSMEDVANLSGLELVDLLPSMKVQEANDLIMSLREKYLNLVG